MPRRHRLLPFGLQRRDCERAAPGRDLEIRAADRDRPRRVAASRIVGNAGSQDLHGAAAEHRECGGPRRERSHHALDARGVARPVDAPVVLRETRRVGRCARVLRLGHEARGSHLHERIVQGDRS
jgi:hypothetical protein